MRVYEWLLFRRIAGAGGLLARLDPQTGWRAAPHGLHIDADWSAAVIHSLGVTRRSRSRRNGSARASVDRSENLAP